METQSELIANTLVWLPMLVETPKTLSADAGIVETNELIYALNNSHPASPLAPIQYDYITYLKRLSHIFKKICQLIRTPLNLQGWLPLTNKPFKNTPSQPRSPSSLETSPKMESSLHLIQLSNTTISSMTPAMKRTWMQTKSNTTSPWMIMTGLW